MGLLSCKGNESVGHRQDSVKIAATNSASNYTWCFLLYECGGFKKRYRHQMPNTNWTVARVIAVIANAVTIIYVSLYQTYLFPLTYPIVNLNFRLKPHHLTYLVAYVPINRLNTVTHFSYKHPNMADPPLASYVDTNSVTR